MGTKLVSRIKQGGKRKGAGRKKKYYEPTITVAFRIPKSKKKFIKQLVNNKLLSYAITSL